MYPGSFVSGFFCLLEIECLYGSKFKTIKRRYNQNYFPSLSLFFYFFHSLLGNNFHKFLVHPSTVPFWKYKHVYWGNGILKYIIWGLWTFGLFPMICFHKECCEKEVCEGVISYFGNRFQEIRPLNQRINANVILIRYYSKVPPHTLKS